MRESSGGRQATQGLSDHTARQLDDSDPAGITLKHKQPPVGIVNCQIADLSLRDSERDNAGRRQQRGRSRRSRSPRGT